MLQQENLADKELVVGSIKVLGNISGGGTEKIKQNMDLLQNTVKTQTEKTDDYWSSLTADGVISAVEKKQLKKEYEGIDNTHTALMLEAEAKGVDMSTEVVAYDTAFENLKTYLNTTLQLFKKMSQSTKIESAEVFNSYYNTYYRTLQNAQSRVNIGESGKIRVISSLTELGTDGEVVLYENNFYMYDLANHEWIGISVASKVGEYMGVRTSSPPQVLNQFFLVGNEGIVEDFIQVVTELRTEEDAALTDENGNIIYINYGFVPGYIYYWSENNEFVQVTDKNNWRYIVAMNDMIACGYTVSPELYEWLTGELAEDIGEEVENNVFAHTPKYSRVQSLPSNPNDGDWIIWDASSTSRFTKGHVYMYQKATVEWIELNPQDTSGDVRSKFMTALTDILQVNPTETGYFSTVFAGAFFGNTATVNSLNAVTIELDTSGYIKSKGYISGEKGFKLNGNGKAEFTDVTISGYPTDEELQVQKERIDAANTAIEETGDALAEAKEELNEVAANYINSVDVEYCLYESATEEPPEGTEWQTTCPEITEGKYIWQRNKITKGTDTISYSGIVCISATVGAVAEIKEQYKITDSSTEDPGEDGWEYYQPYLQSGKVLWTRSEITASDGTVTHSEAVKATALNQTFTDVITANRKVNAATEEYNNAVYIKGELLVNASQSGWILKTTGFNPDDANSTGFGVTKGGNLYANNGVFRGQLKGATGTFTGNVEIGDQTQDSYGFINGSYIGNGVMKSSTGRFKWQYIYSQFFSPGISDYGTSVSFTKRINTTVLKRTDFDSLYNRLESVIPYNDDGARMNYAQGYIDIAYTQSQQQRKYTGQIYGIYRDGSYICIVFGWDLTRNTPYVARVNSSNSVTVLEDNVTVNTIKLYIVSLKGV